MEVKIINESLPVIQINFEEMKTALSETLQKYKGIVVTEDTLSGCKHTQKELAGVRGKIDIYRKDKKKELSKPIEAFENQCKELIALIEQAEKPIKDGIKVFDDVKREEKRNAAEYLIKVVIEEVGLNEKYGSQLVVQEKYCNLTAKESEVKNDLEARAMALRVEQDREAELIEIIKDSVESENQRISTKLEFKDFARMIERGNLTKDILAEVKSRAEVIYRAEHPEPKVEPIVEPITETYLWKAPIEPQAEPIKEADESTYFAVYRITGSIEQLRSVSQFIQQNGIAYRVVEQGEV